jgi:hypothetical protein
MFGSKAEAYPIGGKAANLINGVFVMFFLL